MVKVATPEPLVIPEPAATPSTVKFTVAPTTAAPPVVRVNVAVNVTGPVEPYETEFGLTLLSASVVATFGTVSVPESTLAKPANVAWIAAEPAALPVNTALLLLPAGLRSPATTPPVMLTSDQSLMLARATLSIKLSPASRRIEKTVIELPDVTLCGGTTIPLPSTAVSTRSLAAAPTVILNALLVVPVRPLLFAVNVYPVPTLLIDRLLKVATPLTAFWVTVPASVPPPGLLPIATVIGAELLVTTLLLASSTCTVTAGLITAVLTAFVGCGTNAT